MGALLGDAVVVDDQDALRRTDGGQAVGDDEGGTALGQLVKGALDPGFGHAVQSGGGLVQDEDGGILQKDAGDGYPLLLPAGEHDAPFAHIGLEPVGHFQDIVVDLGLLGGRNDLRLGGVGPSVADIVIDGACKEEHVLLDDADVLPKGVLGEGAHILAVDADGPLGDIIKPVNELDLEHPEENKIYEELSPLLGKIHKQNRQIQKQLELAKQQQEEFSLITENMQEGLIVIDRYTMILSANSSAWNLFRVDKVCQGESVYCLDRAEDFRHAIEQVLSGEHAELILKLNGSDIQLIANPVVRGQKTEGAVILLVNVTEKLERENLRREFSANVSHELKTPLTSISGFAEIMQGGLVKCEDIPKFAGRIYKESQRLLQLVEDVIQISQLDEEKTSYTWELVDVYQVCKNAFESLKEKAQSMNVHLYICGDSMKMEAVRTLLEEAVYNVCDNAIKYNRNDGSVSIFLTQTAHEIQIVVKDTGVGIPKEDQDRVFERFYRVDKSHSKEIGGTGLGLSIVKHAVSTLNGSIVLRSEEGSGTEITMKFLKVHKE